YLDEPTGVRVVGMTNGVIADIDIDASTTTTKHIDEFDDLNPDGQSDVTLARDGYIVLKTRIGVFTVVNGLDQPPRFIGMASSIFASSRGDAFWMARTTRTTEPRLVTVSQIDGNGNVLTQPTSTAPPDNGDWDRSAGTAAKMPGVATGYVLDKHGDMRAVITFGAMSQPTLSLYTPEHGSRLIEDPPGLQAVTCEFSPDGRHLAILYGSTTARLGIIDIATGGLTMVDGSAGLRARRLHWSPKGDRVFVDASAGPRPLTTYRMGDTRMRQLRYIGSVPLEWVVVPARG